MEEIRICRYSGPKASADLSLYGPDTANKARNFHRGFAEYCETPLVSLSGFARENGVEGIFVKDESYRFGLNAFKALGASYAVGCMASLPEDAVLVTATDGNHGRGVAWTAARLGKKSVVYMPKGTARERLDNIRKLGSDASILDIPYDDCVRKAAADASANGWLLVQDTSAPGYEEIPRRIMQGYTTMALEAVEQLGGTIPTHVFLQAGVGSMAGAVSAFLSEYYGDKKPVITVVEPLSADCLYKTALAADGHLHACEGEMCTIMAGLCCGEPCSLAWDALSCCAEFFAAVPDSTAESGMRILAENAVVSGESGASAFGFAAQVISRPELGEIKKMLGIGESSVILCFSTEGATDRENYEKIVGVKKT